MLIVSTFYSIPARKSETGVLPQVPSFGDLFSNWSRLGCSGDSENILSPRDFQKIIDR